MKLSDYFTNILSAIFTPISNDFNKERENIYTSLKEFQKSRHIDT